MLKVVGASWLQTRISTYILVAVALLGIGAIILGEFGHVEKDGTYSATVSWNHKGGYRIDFWGQGNDLSAVPLNAARAYYKTGIFETGWSIIEIETSAKYPDTVQAYAAGLLEGSLTWQLIHHHWYNTVHAVCQKRAAECRKIMRFLRENTVIVRERAELSKSTDPFWHMVRLFYAQLEGLEAGWRFAVRRSRQSVEMESEDFLWLALASDMPDLKSTLEKTTENIGSRGMAFLKALSRKNSEPLIAIGHNTAASYTKMLRLLKKYTFGYHLLPVAKSAASVPGRSIVMSSYPGALSSQDELYLITGDNRELIVAGTPLSITNRSLWSFLNLKDQVMPSIKTMAANRLAVDGHSWSRILSLQSAGSSAYQWITYEPQMSTVWLIEQLSSVTHAADYTEEFKDIGFLSCTGAAHFQEIKELTQGNRNSILQANVVALLQENITTLEGVRKLMQGNQEDSFDESIPGLNTNISQVLAFRGDLESVPAPVGVIDTKLLAVDVDGIQAFEAMSGPVVQSSQNSFAWSKSFPNISHIGQPDAFNFDSVIPFWVWV